MRGIGEEQVLREESGRSDNPLQPGSSSSRVRSHLAHFTPRLPRALLLPDLSTAGATTGDEPMNAFGAVLMFWDAKPCLLVACMVACIFSRKLQLNSIDFACEKER